MTVSIIIPTYNEFNSLEKLIQQIFENLKTEEISAEIIIVDDNSPDGTGKLAEKLKNNYSHLKVIHRPKKMGLASAVIDGIKISEGEIIGVMDADLSHELKAVPALIKAITKENVDLAIGSRYVQHGKITNWPLIRKITSLVAILLAKPVTKVKDATSGFFFIRRSCLDDVKLNPIGFKIGLEIFVKAKYNTFKEVPYTFTDRKKGKSKFNFKEILNYLAQLYQLTIYSVRRPQ